MMNYVKIGAFLGALSFAAIGAIGIHQKMEVDYINSHQPPTLLALQENVVAIQTESGAICSGWISKKSHKIVTTAHCFDFSQGSNKAEVYFKDGTTEIWQTDYVYPVENDFGNDHATLVPLDKTTHNNGGLPVCDFKPYYGEFIVEMGAPYGIDKSMSFGYVQNPDQSNMITVDIKMLPGNSGGPIIDTEEGCVIGAAELIFTHGSEVPYGVNYATTVTGF